MQEDYNYRNEIIALRLILSSNESSNPMVARSYVIEKLDRILNKGHITLHPSLINIYVKIIEKLEE